MHIQKVRDNCKKKVNQLHSVISNRDINFTARHLLLLSVVRPSLEYGNEIWDCNHVKVGRGKLGVGLLHTLAFNVHLLQYPCTT